MSDETHTPGPWQWGDSQLLDAAGAPVIRIDRSAAWEAGDEDLAVSDANARLIAAAPEMLALLRECVTVVDGIQSDGLRDSVAALLDRIDGKTR